MRIHKIAIAVTLAAGLVLAPAATAEPADQAATVTRGQFQTLSGGADLGYDITGHATMVRRPGPGNTSVSLTVRGLDADQAYAVHVHNAPCSATPPGGGHYQHDIGGAVDPVNEIWPAFSTNAAGVGHGAAWHGHVARADAQAIVIHWPQDSAVRLACLDLS